jgi:hypothetical protein
MTVPDDNLRSMFLLDSDSQAGGPHSGENWLTDDAGQIHSLSSGELNLPSSQSLDESFGLFSTGDSTSSLA